MHLHVPAVLPPAAWQLSLYPTAGEAGGCFRPVRQTPRVWVPGQPAADPDRARAEAARRGPGEGASLLRRQYAQQVWHVDWHVDLRSASVWRPGAAARGPSRLFSIPARRAGW